MKLCDITVTTSSVLRHSTNTHNHCLCCFQLWGI